MVIKAGLAPKIAWGRDEHDPCERGTVGCSIEHATGDEECETW